MILISNLRRLIAFYENMIDKYITRLSIMMHKHISKKLKIKTSQCIAESYSPRKNQKATCGRKHFLLSKNNIYTIVTTTSFDCWSCVVQTVFQRMDKLTCKLDFKYFVKLQITEICDMQFLSYQKYIFYKWRDNSRKLTCDQLINDNSFELEFFCPSKNYFRQNMMAS